MSDKYIAAQRRGDNVSDVVHVPCRGLGEILNLRQGSHVRRHFDFLSLDVEGAEDLVIRTVYAPAKSSSTARIRQCVFD